jgi:hypothetical protein
MDGIKIYASYFAVFRGVLSMYFHLYLRLFKGGGYNLKSILPF